VGKITEKAVSRSVYPKGVRTVPYCQKYTDFAHWVKKIFRLMFRCLMFRLFIDLKIIFLIIF